MNFKSIWFMNFLWNGYGFKILNNIGFGIDMDLVSNPSISCSGQKYLYTIKYTCTNCVIYRLLYNLLYSKIRIDIYTYRKYVVLALTMMKFLQFFVFHEVLIY